MDTIIIILVIAIIFILALRSTIKHFKGQGGCCGGGSTYISKKKLKNIIATKTVIIEGMTCENCVARVSRYLNDIEGLAAKVNLRKKKAVVSMNKEIADEQIIAAVEKAGYTVTEIK